MAGNAPMLLHSTYFNLGPNNTPDIGEAYMSEALQYLSTSPGMISFWIGRRALDMNRPENDLNFDIAMQPPTITQSALVIKGKVPGITNEKFQELVKAAEQGCPVSRVLKCEITSQATLV